MSVSTEFGEVLGILIGTVSGLVTEMLVRLSVFRVSVFGTGVKAALKRGQCAGHLNYFFAGWTVSSSILALDIFIGKPIRVVGSSLAGARYRDRVRGRSGL